VRDRQMERDRQMVGLFGDLTKVGYSFGLVGRVLARLRSHFKE